MWSLLGEEWLVLEEWGHCVCLPCAQRRDGVPGHPSSCVWGAVPFLGMQRKERKERKQTRSLCMPSPPSLFCLSVCLLFLVCLPSPCLFLSLSPPLFPPFLEPWAGAGGGASLVLCAHLGDSTSSILRGRDGVISLGDPQPAVCRRHGQTLWKRDF